MKDIINQKKYRKNRTIIHATVTLLRPVTGMNLLKLLMSFIKVRIGSVAQVKRMKLNALHTRGPFNPTVILLVLCFILHEFEEWLKIFLTLIPCSM